MPRPALLAGAVALNILLGAAAATAQTPAPAPAPAAEAVKPVDAAERKAVLEDLASTLEANFVFPDVGARYAAMLRANLTSGAYDRFTDPTEFAKAVTADIQAVSSDGHLKLVLAKPRAAGPGGPGGPRPSFGLEETKMIGDVAYLRYSGFPGDDEATARARKFLLDHAGDAKAVIVDSRGNHGGGLDEMNALLPLLYSETTTLVRMDTRAASDRGNPLGAEDLSLVARPSPATLVRRDHVITPDKAEKRLQHVPVYYLVSHQTASAGEHLALAFKHTHRAVLIGETTRGAGHYGGTRPFGERFQAFIPIGRTYDPDTNWDWEGKGVAPDVAVDPAKALDEALARAKAAGAHPG